MSIYFKLMRNLLIICSVVVCTLNLIACQKDNKRIFEGEWKSVINDRCLKIDKDGDFSFTHSLYGENIGNWELEGENSIKAFDQNGWYIICERKEYAGTEVLQSIDGGVIGEIFVRSEEYNDVYENIRKQELDDATELNEDIIQNMYTEWEKKNPASFDKLYCGKWYKGEFTVNNIYEYGFSGGMVDGHMEWVHIYLPKDELANLYNGQKVMICGYLEVQNSAPSMDVCFIY